MTGSKPLLKVIFDPAEMESLVNYYSEHPLVAVDTETDGTHFGCQVVGASFYAGTDTAHYCVLGQWDKENQVIQWITGAKEAVTKVFASLLGKGIIEHNALFDVRVVRDFFGVMTLDSILADTMLMAHLCDEEGPQGLKDLGVLRFGDDADAEAREMKASVLRNGGIWQDKKNDAIKEMYKADPKILGKYGAKDTVLTWDLFHQFFEELEADELLDFFFVDETMPLFRLATFDMNTRGIRVDVARLKQFEREMTHRVETLKVEVEEEISGYVKELKKFSLGSGEKLAWLLFIKLGHSFRSLTDGGREKAKALTGKIPYTPADKRKFVEAVNAERTRLTRQANELQRALLPQQTADKLDLKEARRVRNAIKKKHPEHLDEAQAIVTELEDRIKARDKAVKTLLAQANKNKPEKFIAVDKEVLADLSFKYEWVKKLVLLRKEEKQLGTYVQGILERQKYGVVYPRFKQTGTDSGRYSSLDPNFQNLTRDDKRIKSCVIARNGKSFVGADYSQLEPRVFSSVSQDARLLKCFADGEDFYSVVGIPMFNRIGMSAFKDEEGSFASKHKAERQVAKAFALASPYGTTAGKQADMLRHPDGRSFTREECQYYIDKYFEDFPDVHKMMLDSHEMGKRDGYVRSLFGRKRRIPLALKVAKMFPGIPHAKLKYEWRQPLNLSMNFRVQGTAASVVNRAMISFANKVRAKYAETGDKAWLEVWILMQVHDEIIVESPDALVPEVKIMLKDSMEKTVTLPGVDLIAEPVIAKVLSELK